MSTCPCCGQKTSGMPDPIDIIGRLHLPVGVSVALLQRLAKSFGKVVSWNQLVDSCYGLDPNGGPDRPKDVLRVLVKRRRPELMQHGINLECVWGIGLRMVWLEHRPSHGVARTAEGRSMSWTDERCDRLRQLWADGHSCSQIAAELGGVTRNAIIGKVHRLGLSGRLRVAAPKPERPKPERKSRTFRDRPKFNFHVPTKAEPDQMEAVDLPPDTAINPVTLLDLQDHHCRWPIGDPGDPGFVFCGADKHQGESYCTRHCRIAYQPPARRERKPWREAGPHQRRSAA